MKTLPQQRGFLAIVAALLIVVIGFLGITIAYMISGGANATNNFQQSEAALDIAEAGFEQAARLTLTPNLTGKNARIACGSITNNNNLTNTSFGSGTFTATTVSGSPIYANTTLSSAITSTSSIISVDSTAGFASAGRIVIDNEIINYDSISENNFISVQRGANKNYSTPHNSGTAVTQYQCNIDVKGSVPNATSALYQREVQQSLQLQEAWAVGNLAGPNFVLTHWNRPTEIKWTNSLFANGAPASLNAVSMLSNADGWAVGNVVSLKFTLLHWDGSSWAQATTTPAACAGKNLTGVSAVYADEAWAVGPAYYSNGSCVTGPTLRYLLLKWNGSSWVALAPSSIPADNSGNQNLNAVHVIDAAHSGSGTLGFAVGNSGTILKYNGTNWIKDTSPTTANLFGVYVVSTSEAWAVGANGTIIKWTGTWSTVSSPTTTQLNSIAMLDSNLSGTANSGWAVGNAGVAVTYNGSNWGSQNTGISNTLLGVAMYFTTPGQDVWAVGTGGTIVHWDGNAWTSVTSNVAKQLNGIALVAPQQYPFAWKEVFP